MIYPATNRRLSSSGGLDWLSGLLGSLGVIALAVLGGLARLFNDSPNDQEPISGRDWARYITCSILAGSVVALIVYDHYGASTLLFAVSGIAGFGSVQLLTFMVEAVRKILEKFFLK